MNRKGFTLIETIMVIALLAVLMLVLVPNVMTIINKNDTESCNNLEESIIKAAKLYVTDNKYELGFSCGTEKIIQISDLVNAGYLKTDSSNEIINPFNDEVIYKIINPDTNEKKDDSVAVTYNCYTKDFDYNFRLTCE